MRCLFFFLINSLNAHFYSVYLVKWGRSGPNCIGRDRRQAINKSCTSWLKTLDLSLLISVSCSQSLDLSYVTSVTWFFIVKESFTVIYQISLNAFFQSIITNFLIHLRLAIRAKQVFDERNYLQNWLTFSSLSYMHRLFYLQVNSSQLVDIIFLQLYHCCNLVHSKLSN